MTFGNLQRVTAHPRDNDVDEVVIDTVDVHIERMDDGLVWMAFYRKGVDSRMVFWMRADRRNDLRTSAYWEGSPWPDVANELHGWNEGPDREKDT